MTKTNNKKPLSKKRKIFNWILSGIFAAVIVMLIVVFLFCIIQIKRGEEPNVLGYKFYIIRTGSMEPELEVGSYILTKRCTAEELVVGDYVTYLAATGIAKDNNVTHSVVVPTEDSSDGQYRVQVEESGIVVYYDKDGSFGQDTIILNPVADSVMYEDNKGNRYILTQGLKEGAPVDDPVPIANVRAKFLKKVDTAFFKPLFDFITGKLGLALLIAVPLLALGIMQIVVLVRNLATDAKQRNTESSEHIAKRLHAERNTKLDEIKKKAIEEYLRSQGGENGENKPSDCSKPQTVEPTDITDTTADSTDNNVNPTDNNAVLTDNSTDKAETVDTSNSTDGIKDTNTDTTDNA